MEEIKIKEISPGERVRLLRERRGLMQKDLAVQTRLSVQTISNLENGKGSPSISTIKKIAEALKVPPTVFFEDELKRKKLLRDELRKKMSQIESLIETEEKDKAKNLLDEVLGLFRTFGEEIQAAAVPDDHLQKSIEESALPETSKEILLYLYQSLVHKKQA